MKGLKAIAFLISCLSLVACGGSSGDSDAVITAPSVVDSSNPSIQGVAAKGIISNGSIEIFSIAESQSTPQLIGKASTDAKGVFLFDVLADFVGHPVLLVISSSESSKMKCDVPSGCDIDGDFASEADFYTYGSWMPLPIGFELKAVTIAEESSIVSNITPLTHIAAEKVLSDSYDSLSVLEESIRQANVDVAEWFGLERDVTKTTTFDVTDIYAVKEGIEIDGLSLRNAAINAVLISVAQESAQLDGDALSMNGALDHLTSLFLAASFESYSPYESVPDYSSVLESVREIAINVRNAMLYQGLLSSHSLLSAVTELYSSTEEEIQYVRDQWFDLNDLDRDGIPDAEDSDIDNDGLENDLDVDRDNDGLIEIASLADLDEMRNNLTGAALYGSSMGCPDIGCSGFELIADLDFDTNGDGELSAADDYFDYHLDGSNKGWLPIGNELLPFAANFEGNSHTVSNLYIRRDETDEYTEGYELGLFGRIEPEFGSEDYRARVSNLHLNGSLKGASTPSENSIYRPRAGLLAGTINSVLIENVFIEGSVSGGTVGCVIGVAGTGKIDNSKVDCTARGDYVAGVLGSGWGAEIWNLEVAISASGEFCAAGISCDAPFVSVWFSNVTGTLISNNGGAAGALGYSVAGYVSGFYAKNLEISGREYAAGVIGMVDYSFANVVASRIDAKISSEKLVGGVIGYNRSDYREGLCEGSSCISSVSKTLVNVDFGSSLNTERVGAIFGYANYAQVFNSHWVVYDFSSVSLIGNQDGTSYVASSFGANIETLTTNTFNASIVGTGGLYLDWDAVDDDSDEYDILSYDLDTGIFEGSPRFPVWVNRDGLLPEIQEFPYINSSPYYYSHGYIRDISLPPLEL